MSKMKLNLEAVRVESCEMAAPIVFGAEPTETRPVSYPCCYSVMVD